jgi:hypothetical protein
VIGRSAATALIAAALGLGGLAAPPTRRLQIPAAAVAPRHRPRRISTRQGAVPAPRFCCGIADSYGASQRRRARQGQPLLIRPSHAQQKRPERERRRTIDPHHGELVRVTALTATSATIEAAGESFVVQTA